jgi:tRNA-dihydrouridine synthase 2
MPPLNYCNKVVLAPMVRIGELPTRLLALRHGADLVWGPETIDRAIIGTTRSTNPRTHCIEFSKQSNAQNRVVYRIHPSEQGRLVYQMGSADATLAVQAAKMVAGDVAGVDLNCGCPKHFSIQGGMGAALLKDIPRLEGILKALVEEVGQVYDIGISCKIRLLDTDQETYDMVRRLCRTGIVGLTVHCRTTPMRNTERALLDRIRGVADVCREEGIPCLANGDVEDYTDALRVMKEYNVDGAMIARAAELNPSCFRREGKLPSIDVAREWLEKVLPNSQGLDLTCRLLRLKITLRIRNIV